ncbi:hypothetical protein [Ottowia sp.]|uniref:hypothetical protein n=1 Tax=Ottowia sp. TaxID=1898956 RepID=UPI003A85502B
MKTIHTAATSSPVPEQMGIVQRFDFNGQPAARCDAAWQTCAPVAPYCLRPAWITAIAGV